MKKFLKKQALNQAVFYGIQVEYFLPLTFLFLVGFPYKIVTNSQQKRF